MPRDKGTKKTFCKSLNWPIVIQWFDLQGTHMLDNDRRAVITMVTRGHKDHYVGFNVEITSKTNGRIESKFFRFDDYLPNKQNEHQFEVIAYCGWKWYIAVPESTEPFTEAVTRWIDNWR